MTELLIVALLALVGIGGMVTVCTEDPARQAVLLSMQGLFLGLLFMVLQAPDVALAQVVVGTAVVPLIVMLTLWKARDRA